jgi:hypothetical protein
MLKLFCRKFTFQKMFLASILLGAAIGSFDVSHLLTQKVIANNPVPGCQENAVCKSSGCDPSGRYCVYNNSGCPGNIVCPNITQ